MTEKIDKELGVVQDPLQQDIITGDVKPGNISMGHGWPIKESNKEEDVEKDYEYLSLIHI